MALLYNFFNFLICYLVLIQVSTIAARPKREKRDAIIDPITGHEFLNLFLEHDDLQKRLHNSEYVLDSGNDFHQVERRGTKSHRFTDYKGLDKSSDKTVKDDTMQSENSKEVVKLVTSGSKIIFFEDYDEENDAALDAEVRDIDLQKKKPFENQNYKLLPDQYQNSNSNDIKILTIGVSSYNQRATESNFNGNANSNTLSTKSITTQYNSDNLPSSRKQTATPTTWATLLPKPAPRFGNLAAKTEFKTINKTNLANNSRINESNLDEMELQKIQRSLRRSLHNNSSAASDTLIAIDSKNSASSNIRKVLASPLQISSKNAQSTDSTYHTNHYNSTGTERDQPASLSHVDAKTLSIASSPSELHTVSNIEEQLLPIQTVIYHDTKMNHGPQSRSISYSSISQNVNGLKNWQETDILSAVNLNVTDSLKHIPKSNIAPVHQSQFSDIYSEPSKFYSEPAKVYSQPAKVYGEPSKFYSEPAKIYSQPSKIYSEPAKSYWPPSFKTNISNKNAASSRSFLPESTTVSAFLNNDRTGASRKPAIVSRIAFGEGKKTTNILSAKPETTTIPTTAMPSILTTAGSAKPFSSNHNQRQYNTRNYFASKKLQNPNSPSSSYHIQFNLGKLPYDLLNAPQPSTQDHSQHNSNNSIKQQLEHQQKKQLEQQQQQQLQQLSAINPCLESAVSTLFSAVSLTSQTQQLQANANPSLSDQTNSNLNVNGVPHADLVRCVAELSHTTPMTTTATVGNPTQFNKALLDISTPEQNYNVDETFTVMTNGRNHEMNLGKDYMKHFQPTLSTTLVVQNDKQTFRFRPLHQRIQFGTKITNQETKMPAVASTSEEHSNSDISQLDGDDRGVRDDYYYDDYATTYKPNDAYADNYNDNDDDSYGIADGADRLGNSTGGATGTPLENDDSKVAYVVEGRNYRKYRVEEKTDDGFIVGEYGVVDHQDGNLRGVRYTADSTINPSLIHKALLTFLKLQ